MRTIVGGRPEKGDGPVGGVARGIDVLLLKGSVDPEFRELLGRDWRAAAAEIELELAESECAILASIPGDVLAEMTARMRVPKSHRRVFLGKTAAAMLVIAAGLGSPACAPPPPRPVPVQLSPFFTDPEVNEPWQWHQQLVAVAGIAPEPEDRTEDFESRDRGPKAGDADPAKVNEPGGWDPPVWIAGAKFRLEGLQDYESEDEDQ
jgi:hypothetical protein